MTDEIRSDEMRGDRRGLLRVAAAALIGTVAGSLRGGTPEASAADNGNLVIGANNTAASKTALTQSGAIADDGAFVVDAASADFGVKATGSRIGVYGLGEFGVFGEGDVGGSFRGTSAALNLVPLGSPGPPTGVFNGQGDLVVDSDGVLWMCVAAGSPGTWILVSHGGLRLLTSPQRAYDSRLDGSSGKIFAPGSSRDIEITSVLSGVPAGARAIACNLTVTETSFGGFLSAYPAGQPKPVTSNLNWSQGGITIANSATVRLGTSGRISVYVEASFAQVIVDVAGYVL
jgi:hypothetical protein